MPFYGVTPRFWSMENKLIKMECMAFAPATVANVGPGYDVLGLALGGVGDRVRVRVDEGAPGVFLNEIVGDHGKLPREAEQNTSSAAVSKVLGSRGLSESLRVVVDLYKGLPLGSGMGSSAASAVAALVAVEGLFKDPLPLSEQLKIAGECEALACGAAHIDNVAPSLMGGMVLLPPNGALPISLPVPEDMWCGVVHPKMELRTEDSRSVLPESVTLEETTKAMGQLGMLISALYEGDVHRLALALEDHLVTPHRSPLIPGFREGMIGLSETEAIGGGISGSGPSVFVLGMGQDSCEKGMAAMNSAFHAAGLETDLWVSKIEPRGAFIL